MLQEFIEIMFIKCPVKYEDQVLTKRQLRVVVGEEAVIDNPSNT